MLRKMKRNVLVLASLVCASALSVATFTSANSVSADNAPNVNLAPATALVMQEGASIRMDIDATTGAVGSDTGIRYAVTVKQELATQLTSGEVTEFGAFIVPAQYITDFETQTTYNDYFSYFEQVKQTAKSSLPLATFGVNDLDSAELGKDGETDVMITIADIKDNHYNLSYQSVAYYVTDENVTYFSSPSGARTVSDVADAALTDTKKTYTEPERTALGNIIEKAIALKHGDGTTATVTAETLKSLDVKTELGVVASDFEVNLVEGEKVVTVSDNLVTAQATEGLAKVSVTAYDGALEMEVLVQATAKANTLVWGASNVTSYGATATATNGDALENVTFGIGAVNEEATMSSFTSTNFPYISYDNTYGTDAVVVMEFTGNNMPLISLFTDITSENKQQIVDQKGILYTNGFTLNGYTATAYQQRMYTLGFYQLPSGGFASDITKASNGTIWADKSGDTEYVNSDNEVNISYNALADTPDTRYRLFLRVYPNADCTKVTVSALAYEINADDTNGVLVYSIEKTRNYTSPNTSYYSGNIVIYGRPYQTTTVDKIYTVQSGTVAGVATNYGPTATDATTLQWMQENGIKTYGLSEIGANNSVTFKAGSFTGTSEKDLGTTDVPYVAFTSETGFGEDDFIAFDFTGNNFPNVSFFGEDITDATKNFVGTKGVMFSTGLVRANGYLAGDIGARLNIFYPTNMANSMYDNAFHTQKDWGTTLRDSANADTKYRCIIGFTVLPTAETMSSAQDTDSLVFKYSIRLIDLTNNTTVYDVVEQQRTYAKSLWGADYNFSGNIIVYGRTYETTKLDKIYTVFENTTVDAVATLLAGATA